MSVEPSGLYCGSIFPALLYECTRHPRATLLRWRPVLLRQSCLATKRSLLVALELDLLERYISSLPSPEDFCAVTIYDLTAVFCSNAMQINLLAPFQAILRPKNQLALFFVSYFVAKLLHLGSHAGSLPVLLYLLYFPTFLLPDVLMLVVSKLLLYRQNVGTARRSFGAFLA